MFGYLTMLFPSQRLLNADASIMDHTSHTLCTEFRVRNLSVHAKIFVCVHWQRWQTATDVNAVYIHGISSHKEWLNGWTRWQREFLLVCWKHWPTEL